MDAMTPATSRPRRRRKRRVDQYLFSNPTYLHKINQNQLTPIID